MEVLLGVCGSIACYKAAHLVSLMRKKDWEVQVVLTKNALQFVQPLTFEYLSGRVPLLPELGPIRQPDHIGTAERCDLFLIAPATANILGKLAAGIGDDLLSTLALALPPEKPRYLAPAMNTHMYLNPLVQRNLQTLREVGYHIFEPTSGPLACGHEGIGRMVEPEEIVALLEKSFSQKAP